MHTSQRVLLGLVALMVLLGTSGQGVGGAPPAKGIVLTALGNYDATCFNGTTDVDCYDEGAVEIAAYDAASMRAFLTFAEQPKIEIVDLSDPANPSWIQNIDLTPWGGSDAHATSVAVSGGVLAAAVPQGAEDTQPGKVLFFDVNGGFINEVTVGALPDMLTFTPNGEMVLTANEGQPTDDYSFDPEGSISIIDMRAGAAALTQDDVSTAGFTAFNAVPIDARIRVFGPGASVAQDLEPEYIAVSHDSLTAWVTLQENNALAIVDLKAKAVTSLVALGFKDHSVAGLGIDASTSPAEAMVKTWPVLGMYQPDAITALNVRGQTYLVTANEGDVREYSGLNAAGIESAAVGSLPLDPTVFPNAASLKTAGQIGNLKVTTFAGDTDGDGDFDELYAFGARSFSIWSAAGELVFDSGDDFEQETAAAFPLSFNASNTTNSSNSNRLDNRSDDKGPEPEGVTVAKLFGRDYLFVALERIGGVMVYEIGDPSAPAFVQYINPRDFSVRSSTPGTDDLGPEGLRVIETAGGPVLMVSNEVSGTLRTYGIAQAQ